MAVCVRIAIATPVVTVTHAWYDHTGKRPSELKTKKLGTQRMNDLIRYLKKWWPFVH